MKKIFAVLSLMMVVTICLSSCGNNNQKVTSTQSDSTIVVPVETVISNDSTVVVADSTVIDTTLTNK